jgi:hypothetical protein
MLADDAVGLDELANITDGSILIGGASNAPTEVAVTGDVTITNAGVTSIGAQKVVNSGACLQTMLLVWMNLQILQMVLY